MKLCRYVTPLYQWSIAKVRGKRKRDKPQNSNKKQRSLSDKIRNKEAISKLKLHTDKKTCPANLRYTARATINVDQEVQARSYPKKILAEVKFEFESRSAALKTKPKKQEKILPFATEFNPAMPNIKQILSKNWYLIEPTVLKKDLPTKTNYIVQTSILPQRHAC